MVKKQIQVKSYAQLHPSTQRATGLTLDLQVPFHAYFTKRTRPNLFPAWCVSETFVLASERGPYGFAIRPCETGWL